jgi:hypothetical protein
VAFSEIKAYIPEEYNTLNREFEQLTYLQSSFSQFSSVQDFCSFVSSGSNKAEAKESVIYYTPKYASSFQGFPSFNDSCLDLASKNYTVCIAKREISSSEILLCNLKLEGIDVSEIDLTTYLIRADALYSFNAIKEESFTVENCNAI